MVKAKASVSKTTKKGGAAKSAADSGLAKAKDPSKKAKIIRILKKKEPQLIEDTKKVLILKGRHVSLSISNVLEDIAKLMKPNCSLCA